MLVGPLNSYPLAIWFIWTYYQSIYGVLMCDFEWIYLIKLILDKSKWNTKWFMFRWFFSKLSRNNIFQCKNYVYTQKLQLLYLSIINFEKHNQFYLKAIKYVKINSTHSKSIKGVQNVKPLKLVYVWFYDWSIQNWLWMCRIC